MMSQHRFLLSPQTESRPRSEIPPLLINWNWRPTLWKRRAWSCFQKHLGPELWEYLQSNWLKCSLICLSPPFTVKGKRSANGRLNHIHYHDNRLWRTFYFDSPKSWHFARVYVLNCQTNLTNAALLSSLRSLSFRKAKYRHGVTFKSTTSLAR